MYCGSGGTATQYLFTEFRGIWASVAAWYCPKSPYLEIAGGRLEVVSSCERSTRFARTEIRNFVIAFLQLLKQSVGVNLVVRTSN